MNDVFKIFISGLLVFIFLTGKVNARNVSQPYLQNMVQVEIIIQETIQKSFPELKEIQIKVKTFNEDDFFFASNFEIWSLLTSEPLYIIQVNPEIFKLNLPIPAAQAILAHELSHTLDYVKGKIPEIITIALKLLQKNTLHQYEHRTDLQAIYRNYGNGLIDYRNWIYPLLSENALKEKKLTYYQPEEIAVIMSAFSQAQLLKRKKLLFHKWYKSPPFGIEQIKIEGHELLYLDMDFYYVNHPIKP